MAQIYVQLGLQYFTDLPRDVSEMSFVFGAEGAMSALDTYAFWGPKLLEWINVPPAEATLELCKFLSPEVRQLVEFKAYAIASNGHLGEPIQTDHFTLAGLGSGRSPLPAEVAVCNSIVGQSVAPLFLPPRRCKGRQFFGPLNDLAISIEDTGHSAAVSLVLRSSLRLASARLAGYNTEDPDSHGSWLVWSRAASTSTAQAFTPVFAGWIDNAFDTQRRRGIDATTRSTWSTV